MNELVDELLSGRRALERVLAKLVASYRLAPEAALASAIVVVRAEIELVVAVLKLQNVDRDEAA